MSWTHSSRVVALGVLLAIAVAVTGTAVAASFSGDAPGPAEVGDDVEMNVTVEDPFVDQPDTWTLRGETELQNATWFVEVRDGSQSVVTTTEASGETVQQDLALEDNHDEVTVTVSGEVPDLEEFDYEDMEVENYTVVELTRASADDGAALAAFESHRYTEESNNARTAIDSAREAVEASGGSDAQAQLDRAIGAYNEGNFELAADLASDAESTAQQSGQTRQLLLIGGVAVVVLAVVGGIVYWWRNRETQANRLQ